MESSNTELNTKTFSPEITTRLAAVEIKRLKMLKTVKTTWIVFAIIVISLAAYLFVAKDESLYFVFGIAGVIFLVVAIAITYFSRGEIAKEFKLKVVLPSINNRENINYAHNNSVSRTEFINSEIFSSGKVDRFKGEDLFYGLRGKTNYKFSEVHVEEKRTTTDSKGRTKTHYVTVFKGIFMIADFNKYLTTTTRVIRGGDNFFEKLFAGKSKVTLENPTFENIFNTYSSDQVEARYILSPAMMERILELKELFNTNINLSFSGNHVYLAISTLKNHFEPKLGKKIDVKQLERIYQEIEACLKIIDTLDLNTRIWTKN